VLDLFVFHRSPRDPHARGSAVDLFWIALALGFAVIKHYWWIPVRPPPDRAPTRRQGAGGAGLKYVTAIWWNCR